MKLNAKLLINTGLVLTTLVLVSCTKDDDKPKTIPEVITFDESDVTTTTVTVGGKVTSDGNDEILSSGIVYSNENNTPTLEALDAFAEGELLEEGDFNLELSNLESGTTYHYRAYAVNSKGVGYGEVKDFTLGNAAPTVSNVAITGTIEVDQEVTADYDYDDAEGDLEEGTTFQWYVADDAAGTNETAISGATEDTYTIALAYEFKYLRVAVKPKAGTGTTDGTEVRSSLGHVAVSTTYVHFTYNGQEVAYGIITSDVTGKNWLDRNLGATRVAQSIDDYQAYGDLFQWGRGTDGHQTIVWTGVMAGAPSNTTTTTVQSTTDVPGHTNFVILSAANANPSIADWRNPQNNSLWQEASQYANNPCPEGWRIPTSQEWINENIPHLTTGFANLKLVAAGDRRTNGQLNLSFTTGVNGIYSTASVSTVDGKYVDAFEVGPESAPAGLNQSGRRIRGTSVRCIKNN